MSGGGLKGRLGIAVTLSEVFLRGEKLDWGKPDWGSTASNWYRIDFAESERVVLVNPQDGSAQFLLAR